MKSAKLFKNGRSQAVRLPAEFRFEGDAVHIRRDPLTGDVILSPYHGRFDDFIALRDRLLTQAADEFQTVAVPRDPAPPTEREWP